MTDPDSEPGVEVLQEWFENPGGLERTRRRLVRVHREDEPSEKMLYERREKRETHDGEWEFVPVTRRRSMRYLEDVPQEEWPEHHQKGWIDVPVEFSDAEDNPGW